MDKTQSQLDLEEVLEIGEQFNMYLSNYYSIEDFVENLLIRIGKPSFYADWRMKVERYQERYLTQ